MSIEKVSPSELFNRLIKSILTLQKEHGYKLCDDFDAGVRKIADTLLAHAIEQENKRRQQWQRKNRKPLKISIKETRTQRITRELFPLFVLVFLCLAFFAVGMEYGKTQRLQSAPPVEQVAGPVPIITPEEFTEMVERCQN